MCKSIEHVSFQTDTASTNPERIDVAINNFQLEFSGFTNPLWHAHAHAKIRPNRASTQNEQTRVEALSKAYEYDLKGFEANPLEVNSIYILAFSAWESGNGGRQSFDKKPCGSTNI
jgi:hypothetical protein